MCCTPPGGYAAGSLMRCAPQQLGAVNSVTLPHHYFSEWVGVRLIAEAFQYHSFSDPPREYCMTSVLYSASDSSVCIATFNRKPPQKSTTAPKRLTGGVNTSHFDDNWFSKLHRVCVQVAPVTWANSTTYLCRVYVYGMKGSCLQDWPQARAYLLFVAIFGAQSICCCLAADNQLHWLFPSPTQIRRLDSVKSTPPNVFCENDPRLDLIDTPQSLHNL